MDQKGLLQLMQQHGIENLEDAIKSFNFAADFLRLEKAAGGGGDSSIARQLMESAKELEALTGTVNKPEHLFVLILEDTSVPEASFIRPFLVSSIVNDMDLEKELLADAKADYEKRFPEKEFTWGNICEDFSDSDWAAHGLRPLGMQYAYHFAEFYDGTLE